MLPPARCGVTVGKHLPVPRPSQAAITASAHNSYTAWSSAPYSHGELQNKPEEKEVSDVLFGSSRLPSQHREGQEKPGWFLRREVWQDAGGAPREEEEQREQGGCSCREPAPTQTLHGAAETGGSRAIPEGHGTTWIMSDRHMTTEIPLDVHTTTETMLDACSTKQTMLDGQRTTKTPLDRHRTKPIVLDGHGTTKNPLDGHRTT